MNNEINESINTLKNFLSKPENLGKTPIKIIYTNSFRAKHYKNGLIFKYKSSIFGKWLIAITFSNMCATEMKAYNEKTEIEDAKKLFKDHIKNLLPKLGTIPEVHTSSTVQKDTQLKSNTLQNSDIKSIALEFMFTQKVGNSVIMVMQEIKNQSVKYLIPLSENAKVLESTTQNYISPRFLREGTRVAVQYGQKVETVPAQLINVSKIETIYYCENDNCSKKDSCLRYKEKIERLACNSSFKINNIFSDTKDISFNSNSEKVYFLSDPEDICSKLENYLDRNETILNNIRDIIKDVPTDELRYLIQLSTCKDYLELDILNNYPDLKNQLVEKIEQLSKMNF